MQVWDLRKTKQAVEVQPFERGAPTCCTFDFSGKYLVCCRSFELLQRHFWLAWS